MQILEKRKVLYFAVECSIWCFSLLSFPLASAQYISHGSGDKSNSSSSELNQSQCDFNLDPKTISAMFMHRLPTTGSQTPSAPIFYL
ncbi:unnamed protein product [Prunus brigantina]